VVIWTFLPSCNNDPLALFCCSSFFSFPRPSFPVTPLFLNFYVFFPTPQFFERQQKRKRPNTPSHGHTPNQFIVSSFVAFDSLQLLDFAFLFPIFSQQWSLVRVMLRRNLPLIPPRTPSCPNFFIKRLEPVRSPVDIHSMVQSVCSFSSEFPYSKAFWFSAFPPGVFFFFFFSISWT